jgi:tyrosinase
MAISVEVSVNGSADAAARYLTWSPSQVQLRVVDAAGALGPVSAVLRNAAGNVGRLAFRLQPTDDGEEELELQLPVDGAAIELLMSGEFGEPSVDDGDATLEVVIDGSVVAAIPFMVRIRKNAESMTPAERDRFVSAFAELNNHGLGPFQGFYAMHTADTNAEAHGLDAFLPWHRAYLLDLERELQLIDPSVALPYWRFDQPAPNLFSADFFGAPTNAPNLPVLSPANPLRAWTIDGVLGIMRNPRFADPRTSAASPAPGLSVRTQAELLITTGPLDYAYEDFDDESLNHAGFRDILEGNPHGWAHVSFSGFIRSPSTAAKDPLFFLLHCNVDRLWALWQWLEQRFDPDDPTSYFYRGTAGDPVATRIGHNLNDTMWPWNNQTGGERPLTAPRHPFPSSSVVAGPQAQPTVGDMIDYQGVLGAPALGFDYDDVPFEKA